ncbi:MAG TPA: hypothetical protein VIX59_10295 [Candidatus Binataceae bacterium]|jgi:ketosteroid isomerase-like protein
MSEQENLRIVQSLYKAFTDGNLSAIINLLTEDVDWQFPENQAPTKTPWAPHGG